MKNLITVVALTGVLHAQQGENPPAPAPKQLPPALPDAQNEKANEVVVPAKLDPVTLGKLRVDGGLQEPAANGETIKRLYETFTGKRVIMSREALTKEISLVQNPPLTYAEAARILETTAMLEGLVFIPSSEPNEVKLVVAANGNKEGFPLVTNAADLPKADKVVTYVMSFDHISSEEALRVFNTLVRTFNPQGVITPVANTSTVLITENTALIRTLVKIKEEIDLPQELFTNSSVQLNHSDAEDVAEKVQTILDFSSGQNVAQSGGGQSGGNNRPTTARTGNNNQSGGNSRAQNNQRGAATESAVLLTSVGSTNRIYITGKPIEVRYAENLIADFDSPSQRKDYYRHKLHFLAVSEFLEIAGDAINRTTNRVGEEGGNLGGGGGGNNNNAGGGQNTGDNDLINEMDIASDQVQITAVFGRYTITDDLDFGVDFARTFQSTRGGSSGFALSNRTSSTVLIDPSTLTDAAALNAAPIGGLSIYGQIGNNFFPTLNAMKQLNKFKLTARPSIFTTNNKKAVLSSGQSIAVPTNTLSQNTTDATSVSQSTNIEFQDVLLKLEVVPLVNSDDEVTLNISFVNDTIVGSTTIDGNDIPTIGKEELVTTVTVPNNQTIVLGGLITERSEDNKTGVPILSQIPGIGRLFSSTSKDILREELVIFIQPRIVSREGDLARLQAFNRTKSKLTRDIQGEGVLPAKDKTVKSYPKAIPVDDPDPRKGRYRGYRR